MKLRTHLQRRVFQARVGRNLAKLREKQEFRKQHHITATPRETSQLDKTVWEKLRTYWRFSKAPKQEVLTQGGQPSPPNASSTSSRPKARSNSQMSNSIGDLTTATLNFLQTKSPDQSLCFGCEELIPSGELKECFECGEKFCPECRAMKDVKLEHRFQPMSDEDANEYSRRNAW